MKIAAVGDLHCKKTSGGAFEPLFAAMGAAADVLVLCGDLTDYGLPDEARVLVKELGAAKGAPVVGVLGNHDYESGEVEQVKAILDEAGVQLLDGDVCEIQGVGFAGVKGLGGGFGVRALQPWGEEIIKRFVRETVEEALKLESALARLTSTRRVAILHYSPIVETVQGESPEIFPYLGSSRLEEPLLRYPVSVVLHGHAHHGRLAGRTRNGVPVYNVCVTVLQRAAPGLPPFWLVDLDHASTAVPEAEVQSPSASTTPVRIGP
ncbi:MAG TPA: metallophosphoesterase [Actinomycetota bacterium]